MENQVDRKLAFLDALIDHRSCYHQFSWELQHLRKKKHPAYEKLHLKDVLHNFISWGTGAKADSCGQKKNGGQWTSNASDKLALELCLSILQKSLAVQRHKLLQVNCSREGIESSWEAYCNVIGSSKVKWKRRVICSAHWSSRKIQMPEDLPDIKHASVSNDKDTTFGRWHWNCAATLWNNSWRTPGLHN